MADIAYLGRRWRRLITRRFALSVSQAARISRGGRWVDTRASSSCNNRWRVELTVRKDGVILQCRRRLEAINSFIHSKVPASRRLWVTLHSKPRRRLTDGRILIRYTISVHREVNVIYFRRKQKSAWRIFFFQYGCQIHNVWVEKQEAQLSQRDRAMFSVTNILLCHSRSP